MLENVPGLLADKRSDTVRRRLERMGYECRAKVFDAARFGVPQRRRRMIMLGARGNVPAFAKMTRRRTVSQAIRFLPPPEQSTDPAHNYDVRRAAKVLSLIRRIPKDGGSRTDLPLSAQLPCHRDFDGFRDIYGRMAWRNPGPTITGGCINPSKGRFVHPEEDRAITLREAALLQGFPVSYEFDLSRGRYPVAPTHRQRLSSQVCRAFREGDLPASRGGDVVGKVVVAPRGRWVDAVGQPDDVYFVVPKNSLIRCSSTSVALVSHSQRTSTVHPCRWSRFTLTISRWMFPSSFRSQNSRLVPGRRPRGQSC